ncbi:MAG: acetoacetate--CoA ligase, partial [Clostridia bacterium]
MDEGTLLWEPSARLVETSNVAHMIRWLAAHKGLTLKDYDALYEWSVRDINGFWSAMWEYFELGPNPGPALSRDVMPGAEWFPAVRMNYADAVLRRAVPGGDALTFETEGESPVCWTWDRLVDQVARARLGLERLGVREGDRVVAYIPNIPEAVVALLATASLGAVWSCCSPDFGTGGVVDRFRQVEPSVLIAVDGYRYGGRVFDRRDEVNKIRAELPSLRHVVMVPYQFPEPGESAAISTWRSLTRDSGPLQHQLVGFQHPLWVVYSSGTTGLPKPIVQSHGGITLTHLVHGAAHFNLKPDSRFFWFTTTGWMMWNTTVGALLTGAHIVLYDGNPAYPRPDFLFELAERNQLSLLGASAAFLGQAQKTGLDPARRFNLSSLEAVGSTGSPLSPEQFAWVYDHVKSDLWLSSASGGTDLCSKLVGGVPTLPVHAGELQRRCLGMSVQAFNEAGQPVVGEIGELVITRPTPSMPLYFWNDPEGRRYRASYFERYPGVWHHGDWIKFTDRGSAVIYGRSDATINRHGVRMGSSEIYRVVENMPEVTDSLAVDLEYRGRASTLALFVVLADGESIDTVREQVRARIRRDLSPRHVPDVILPVAAIPRTLNGKKLEVP